MGRAAFSSTSGQNQIELLHLNQAVEQVLAQLLVARRPVEPLHTDILLRLAQLDIFDPAAALSGPSLSRLTDVFGAVITT